MTSEWSGQGLSPAAQARVAEMRGRRSWGSALSVSEFAAISRVGFKPVGQVLGAAVYNIGDTGGEDCPYGLQVYRAEGYGNPGYGQQGPGAGLRIGRPAVRAPVGAAALGSARPLVATLYRARRAAIDRMTAECAALGGHGVIGVSLTVGPFAEGSLEFKAFGTAVQAPGAVKLSRPFASDLSGQDFTKLVAHGWVPVGLALGVAVEFRHDDWLTRGQTRWGAGNVEVDGYTYLVSQTRADARNELELDLIKMGAEGVVVRELETRISERSCPIVPHSHDHVVESTIVGTAIAQFAQLTPPPVYGVHKMSERRRRPAEQQKISVSLEGDAEEVSQEPDAEPGSPESAEPEQG